MSTLRGLDSSTWVSAFRRGQGTTRPLAAVEPAGQARSVLGPALDPGGFAIRIVNAKDPVATTATSQTEDEIRQATTFTGFDNRLSTEHAVSVRSLAAAAEANSQGFASGDTVRVGTLTLSLAGTSYNATLTGGTLNDVVAAIRASGAPVDAAVSNDGTKDFLTVKARQVGYDPAGTADDALSLSETYTGAAGQALQARVVKDASNAEVIVDGNRYVRQSNTISDVLPGTTLKLDAVDSPSKTSFVNQPFKAGLAASAPPSVYNVSVKQLASAAEAQSQAFTSPFSSVQAGTLNIVVAGTTYKISVVESATLGDVANRIGTSGAPVDVAVKAEGGNYKLAITSRTTGYALGGNPEDALAITEESSGTTGQALAVTTTQAAVNAEITVNGTKVESPSNVVAGSVPGLRFDLKTPTKSPETVVGNLGDLQRAQGNLVDASNEVFRVLQDRLLTLPPQPLPLTSSQGKPNEIKAPDATFSTGDHPSGDRQATKTTPATTATKTDAGTAAKPAPLATRIGIGDTATPRAAAALSGQKPANTITSRSSDEGEIEEIEFPPTRPPLARRAAASRGYRAYLAGAPFGS